MNIPAELKYTKEHEWVKMEGNVAVVGITDYAQSELGDIVFIELPEIGDEIVQAKPFGVIEAVKAVSDMFAPVSGKVAAINNNLDDNPMVINQDPYGEGWMLKIELSDMEEIDKLLDADSYKKIIS
ncbi:MAG: glycine cleavage system protein GcvH [Candidatus Zixiibacteriota bacterium]